MKTWITLLFSLIAAKSAGSVLGDRQNQTEPAVSECIRSKWDVWVSRFDVNRDGVLAVDDMKKARNTFSNLHNLTGEDKNKREGIFTQYWKEMILLNKTEITPNKHVALRSSAFLEDKENFVKETRDITDRMNHCVDVDNDDYISEKEEMIIMKSIGLTDNRQDHDFFQGFHAGDKGVPVEDMTSYWVTYLTEDDCSKTNLTTQ